MRNEAIPEEFSDFFKHFWGDAAPADSEANVPDPPAPISGTFSLLL